VTTTTVMSAPDAADVLTVFDAALHRADAGLPVALTLATVPCSPDAPDRRWMSAVDQGVSPSR
jgi:hypothetical protein